MILIEFIQDKCDLLDDLSSRLQEVKVSINLRGREWINPQGEAKYFNSIQGWSIYLLNNEPQQNEEPINLEPEEGDGLPF